MSHGDVEQLLLQTLLGDGVVDDHRLAGDVGAVVGVGQLGAQVQLEVIVPVNLLIPELDRLGARHRVHDDVLLQHRVDHRVDVLVEILKQKRKAVLHGELELLQKVGVVEGLHLAFELLALALLDPRHRLHLGIDAQREAGGAGGEDTVLHRELVRGEPVGRPLASLHVAREQRLELERGGHGDIAAGDVVAPQLVGHLLSEVERERTGVGQERRGEQAISEELLADDGELLEILGPSHSFAGQARDELLRSLEASLHELSLVLEPLLLRGGCLERLAQLGEFGVESLNRGFDLDELRLSLFESFDTLGHLEALGLDTGGDLVVVHHRQHPLEHARGGLGHGFDLRQGELLVLHVPLDGLDLVLGDAVLLKLLQGFDKVEVRHHGLRTLPADLLLGNRLQDLHALQHLHDDLGGIGVGLEVRDVVLVDVLQRLRRLLERGDSRRQISLSLLLLLGDAHAVLGELRLLRRGRRLLLLNLGGVLGDHLEELLHLHRLGLNHNFLVGELDLHLRDILGSHHELLQTPVEAVGVVGVELTLRGEALLVVGDEVEVVLGRHVVMPAELVVKLDAVVPHRLVRQHHVLRDGLPELIRHVEVPEEHLGDGPERILGPRGEPIDDGVVHHPWEVPASRAKGIAHRGHGQHDVEVVPAPVHVVPPARLLRLAQASLGAVVPHAAGDALLLVVRVETGDHTRGEHVVDELEETLVGDVRVGEEENHLSIVDADFRVQRLQILPEHGLVVAACQRDLEHPTAGGVRRELGQRLLTRSADAHQERVALVQSDDSVDPGEVLERILEKDEVHLLVQLVVVAQDLLEPGFDVAVRAHVLVQTKDASLGSALLLRRELLVRGLVVAKQNRILQNNLLVLLKLGRHQLVHLGHHDLLILVGDEPVVEDAERLVAPQPEEVPGALELVVGGAQETLVDSAQIAEVEDVVEPGRRRRQLVQDEVVQLQGDVSEVLCRVLDLIAELHDVRLEYGRVDRAEVVLARELNLKRAEQRDEPGVNRVPGATRRAHRRDVEEVLHLLPVELLAAVVHAAALDEGLEQRDGLLGAVQVNLRHVEVVKVQEHSLAHRGSKRILGALLHRPLEHALDVHRRGAR